MGLFNNLFKGKHPVNSDPFFDFIYDYFDSGSDDFDVNDKGVINISSDIYAITSRIANDIADKKIVTGTQYVSSLLNKNINNYMDTRTWLCATLQNLLLYGDSFSLVTRDSNGMVQSIDLLPTYQVTVNVLQDNNGLQYQYSPNGETYNDQQVLHFKLNSLNGLVGTSPLLALKNTLELSNASNKLLRNYYDNTAFNKVLLQVDDKLPSKDRAKIKKAFSQNLGSNNAGGTIISDNTVNVKPFNTSNVNSNIIKETKNSDYFAKKIASVYGVPSALLGVQNPHANGSDTMAQYQQDLKPYESIIISELNNKLNGNYSFEDPIPVQSATDVANLSKGNAITPQQAQQLLGLNN